MNRNIKTLFAVVAIFISCSLVPFATFSLFKNSFNLEPQNFWRFTPATPLSAIPINWIIATIVANIIIAALAVWTYSIFHKAIRGSWFRRGLIFAFFAIVLGVLVPLWSFYTLSNISLHTTLSLMVDGTFEYLLYTFMIAFILRNKISPKMEVLTQGDITLKPLDIKNAEYLFNMVDRNRQHIAVFLGWTERTKNVVDSRKFIEKCLQGFKDGEQITLEIWYKDAFVGLIDFHSISQSNKSAEVGYWIDKDYEGKGIVTNSCKLFFKYGFEKLGFNRIEIRVNTENEKSFQIPKGLGFIKDGVLRQSRVLRDGFQDMEIWSMLRSEYQNLSEKGLF